MKTCNSTLTLSLLCGILLGSGCAVSAQAPQPAGGVSLAAQFPADVTIDKMPRTDGPPITSATVELTLSNNSSAPVTLQATNDCESRKWFIVDSAGQRIDDRVICPMIFMPVTQTIAPHGTYSASKMVSLTSSKYQDGGHYTLHYSFWGVAAQASFTTHSVQ